MNATQNLTTENIASAVVVDCIDTRDIEWVNDKPRRAAGTGNTVASAICGKGAEIHTVVRLAGSEFIVGGSCAKLVYGGGKVRTVRVGDPVLMAGGNGWSLYRLADGTHVARGVNAEHPKVLAIVADYNR